MANESMGLFRRDFFTIENGFDGKHPGSCANIPDCEVVRCGQILRFVVRIWWEVNFRLEKAWVCLRIRLRPTEWAL